MEKIVGKKWTARGVAGQTRQAIVWQVLKLNGVLMLIVLQCSVFPSLMQLAIRVSQRSAMKAGPHREESLPRLKQPTWICIAGHLFNQRSNQSLKLMSCCLLLRKQVRSSLLA
jgi:hypothetical protein